MRTSIVAIVLGGAMLLSCPWNALAADHPTPSPPDVIDEAAGPWTLEANGRPICVLDFGKEKVGPASFALTVPMACDDALHTTGMIAWSPARDGVALVGFDDRAVMRFSRTGDDLLIFHPQSGAVFELQRSDRNPRPAHVGSLSANASRKTADINGL